MWGRVVVLMHVLAGALLAAGNRNSLQQDKGLDTLRLNTRWRERPNLTDIAQLFWASPAL